SHVRSADVLCLLADSPERGTPVGRGLPGRSGVAGRVDPAPRQRTADGDPANDGCGDGSGAAPAVGDVDRDAPCHQAETVGRFARAAHEPLRRAPTQRAYIRPSAHAFRARGRSIARTREADVPEHRGSNPTPRETTFPTSRVTSSAGSLANRPRASSPLGANRLA